MKNFWKKAAAGICAVAMLAVSAASTGLTASAYYFPVDPETGWEYQVVNDANGNPSYVNLWSYTRKNVNNLTVPATFTIPDTSITVPTRTDNDKGLISLEYVKPYLQ